MLDGVKKMSMIEFRDQNIPVTDDTDIPRRYNKHGLRTVGLVKSYIKHAIILFITILLFNSVILLYSIPLFTLNFFDINKKVLF